MVNTKPVKLGKNIRQSFAHIDEVAEMPNLIEVQKNSYQWFLDEGLRAVFKDISSITDYQGNLQLDFIDFTLDDKPKYPLLECKERDVNYAAPLRVRARLINKVTGEIKESDIYMGDFPLMTDAGTFIINGAERVIVSQLVRSPGVYYGMHHDPAGKKLFDSTVIPNRGAWLEYDTDSADVFSVRIDKNRKLPITTFIRSLLRLRDARSGPEILIGAGVSAAVIDELRAALPGARAFHASCKKLLDSGMTFRREGVPMGLPGLDEWHIQQTDAEAVRAAKDALMR